MTQFKATPRDAATNTSPSPLAEGDMPEQDGSEDPQVGLQFMRDTAVIPEKEQAQSKGMAPEGVPPSPSTMEHVNTRRGVSPTDKGQGHSSSNEDLKTGTVGVGEGATVSHLPDGGKP